MRAFVTVLLLASLAAAELSAPAEWLAIEAVDRRGRRPFNPDAVFRRYLLGRDAPIPREGEEVEGSGRTRAWTKVRADEKGRVSGRFAYAYAPLRCEKATIALARLHGGAVLFVNGDPFVGDVYGMRNSGVPVPLARGTNHLFVRGVRGSFKLDLAEVEEGEIIAERDATLPDLVVGEEMDMPAGLVVLNASARPSPGLVPFGVRKLPAPVRKAAPREAGTITIPLGVGQIRARPFELRIREPGKPRRRTFVSGIDGSVQEYSVLPPLERPAGAGIVLTLHGASVDAFNQARAYSPKKELWIVAPTNRRPFGFDWQDWGRTDAYEVLADALAWTHARPGRVYLTGHSMGGHGTWHLAANDPDRFLAIAPSAGWCGFDTYAGGRPGGKLTDLWRGADGSSLTMTLVPNLARIPTYILHGEKDDNVPPTEALTMELLLWSAGGCPSAHYQPGAGHWWDGKAADGADCVDWPGIFDHFARHEDPRLPKEFDFVSVDPGVDADHYWLHLHQPLRYGEPMHVRASLRGRQATIQTRNVRRMKLSLPRAYGVYVIDGSRHSPASGEWYLRTAGGWKGEAPTPREKSPERSGPFKRAFGSRFVLVYGKDDPESMKRARYDAQVWWYRGNGDAPVLSDAQFLAGDYRGRHVIVYGNATTNRAFEKVLGRRCPIRVRTGVLEAGAQRWTGPGLSCLLVYPRADDEIALAAAFAHTGDRGARLGYTLLPFVSGVGYPDYAVFGEDILEGGDEGVLAAGWFSHDWSLSR